jgi:hypothetical protein
MKEKNLINQKRFSEGTIKSLQKYLKDISFDKRLERGEITAIEMKEILLENLRKYFQGKVTQEFIIALGNEIQEAWWEAKDLQKEDVLGTVACEMVNLLFADPRKSPEQIQESLRWALKTLEKDLNEKKALEAF